MLGKFIFGRQVASDCVEACWSSLYLTIGFLFKAVHFVCCFGVKLCAV